MLTALNGISQSLDAYLVLSGILFAIGAFGFLARRNAISMLMSIELMLNAVNLSIIAFGAFTQKVAADGTITHPLNPSASVIALVVMAAAAAEATDRPRDRHRDLPQQEDAARRRVRRDAAVAVIHLLPVTAFAATDPARDRPTPASTRR